MAENLIVAVFSNTQAACDVAGAIKNLESSGSEIKLKSGILVTKDERGDVSVLDAESHPFRGSKVGIVVGGLIGLLGGAPIAAVGALLGATVGAINDSGMAILRSATVSSIKDAMHPGTTAVILEADEVHPNAVNEIVEQAGGRVFREAT
jgi:uncharacterized membrane protein